MLWLHHLTGFMLPNTSLALRRSRWQQAKPEQAQLSSPCLWTIYRSSSFPQCSWRIPSFSAEEGKRVSIICQKESSVSSPYFWFAPDSVNKKIGIANYQSKRLNMKKWFHEHLHIPVIYSTVIHEMDKWKAHASSILFSSCNIQ